MLPTLRPRLLKRMEIYFPYHTPYIEFPYKSKANISIASLKLWLINKQHRRRHERKDMTNKALKENLGSQLPVFLSTSWSVQPPTFPFSECSQSTELVHHAVQVWSWLVASSIYHACWLFSAIHKRLRCFNKRRVGMDRDCSLRIARS